MGRIEARFAALKKGGRTAFVAYLTAGDPDLETTAGLIPALEAAGFTVVGTVDYGSSIFADLNGDHFNGATVTALGANGVVAMGGMTTTLSLQILNTTPVTTNGTTLNLLNGVRITVLDLSNGHSWGGISGDVGTVQFSGMSAERTNGQFSGTLQPNAGSGATGVLTIANGSFYMRILAP